MRRVSRRATRQTWKLAALAGLLTSTVSTLLIIVTAPRTGRGVALSWMEVAMVLLRKRAIRVRPTAREYLAGVLVHQFADFAWAMAFFGLAARWTQQLRTRTLLALATPWALATSFVEYYLILPRLQPWLRMQSPYWINLAAHVASGSAYPLFPWLRQLVLRRKVAGAAASRRWAQVLAGIGGTFTLLTALGHLEREARWPFGRQQARHATRRFLHHMTAHHQIGIRLMELAVAQGERYDFRKLNELMLAEHLVETSLMCGWWRSWYREAMPRIGPKAYMHMAGMPAPATIRELERLQGLAFEARYLVVMINHHLGAIEMCNKLGAKAHDPRIRLLANQIRHTQHEQIMRMEQLLQTLPSAERSRSVGSAPYGR